MAGIQLFLILSSSCNKADIILLWSIIVDYLVALRISSYSA